MDNCLHTSIPIRPSTPGAPGASPSFFCDPGSGRCFNYSSLADTFAGARERCAAQGGGLFMPHTAAKQLLVEAYFANSSALTQLVYWLGIQRRSERFPFAFLDNAVLAQNVSNEPYAHWNWLYPGKRQYPYHCGVARYSTMYDWFVGDISTIAVSDYFVTGTSNTDRK